MATGADIRPHRIVVVGGGFGGIARDTLRRDFRRIDPRSARILPLEGTDRVLPAFPPVLSAKAKRSLERLGVTVALDALVTDVDREGVTVRPRQGRAGRIPTRTVLWTAGGAPASSPGKGPRPCERRGCCRSRPPGAHADELADEAAGLRPAAGAAPVARRPAGSSVPTFPPWFPPSGDSLPPAIP